MRTRVLIVDDDATIRSMYARYLMGQSYQVKTAANLAEAEKALEARHYDALIVDMILPDGNSLDKVADLREANPDMAIVMITADGAVHIAVEAMRRGADNFLCKPVSLADLDVFLRKALETETFRRSHIALQRQVSKQDPYFGKGRRWEKVMELVSVATENDAVVLLLGETGSGKGVMARWIHEHSSRSGQPFVEVNCSSLRGEMLASELFGHVKGAFTSAVQDKQGLIEVASNGTLFLDEIGDMDIAVQAQFLKVVEEKRYRRVGDVKERSSEFRLICATNHDLEEQCRKQEFREDLFFRINVFPIRVLSLRDMPEDLPELARHLLDALAPGKQVELTPEVMEVLQEYEWPGNIRELRNVLERSLLLARNGGLSLEHLPGLMSPISTRAASDPSLNLNLLEKDRIRAALIRFDNDTDRAAKALGMSRATLYRRLKSMKDVQASEAHVDA